MRLTSQTPPPREGEAEAAHPAGAKLSFGARLLAIAGWIARLLATGYLLSLLVVVAAFRLIGERWWFTTVALYLPRIGFALPLPPLVLALLLTRSYRTLLTQLAAVFVLLFPLMGLHLGGSGATTAGSSRFRLFTLNIGLGMGRNGTDDVLARIHDVNPDVVVLEEVAAENLAPLRAGLAGYAFRSLDQFVVASRFPIEDDFVPSRIWVGAEEHSSHFARCRLVTPAGPVRLMAVHPISPHDAFDRLRGEGLIGEILSGRIFHSRARATMMTNTAQRLAQIEALADDAAQSHEPVIIAGDTNLPGLSWALAHWLGGYQDSFSQTGRGFGYTYPAHKKVWMRIDRILAGPRFKILSASTVAPPVYQHLALTADLELAPLAP